MQKDNWNPNLYKKSAAFVSKLAMPVVDLLDPKEGERILDLGCGEGELAIEISKRGSIVEAVDFSARMVQAAKARGINAKIMSATNLTYENKFDAVFSNAVLHWVLEPKTAIKNINKALKERGRFIAEFGAEGNVANIVNAMKRVFKKHPEFKEYKDIWYFPTISEYKKLLEENGFRVEYIKSIPRATSIDDINNWIDLFTKDLTKSLNNEQIKIFKSEVKEILKKSNYSKKEGWIADYVRLRVKAIKID